MASSSDSWDPFVLLLIDVQKDFWEDGMSSTLADYETSVGNLLSFCRQEQLDIVHLRAAFRDDKSDWMASYKLAGRIPCIEGTPGADIFPCASERTDEKVIMKQTFDGFHNPALQDYLQANDKKFVLVAGLVTSVCVLLTAASAAQRGYLVGLVEDCCADTIDAHQNTLDGYPFVFCRTQSDRLATDRKQWLFYLQKLANV